MYQVRTPDEVAGEKMSNLRIPDWAKQLMDEKILETWKDGYAFITYNDLRNHILHESGLLNFVDDATKNSWKNKGWNVTCSDDGITFTKNKNYEG